MDATAGGAAAEAGNGESTACSRENGGSGWESNLPGRSTGYLSVRLQRHLAGPPSTPETPYYAGTRPRHGPAGRPLLLRPLDSATVSRCSIFWKFFFLRAPAPQVAITQNQGLRPSSPALLDSFGRMPTEEKGTERAQSAAVHEIGAARVTEAGARGRPEIFKGHEARAAPYGRRDG
jgi:hypothetical protein